MYQGCAREVNAGYPCGEWNVTAIMEAALALVLRATLDVAAGGSIAAAVAAARPGDVVRLAPGTYRGALGRLSGIAVEGAGAGRTEVVAPEGEDCAVVAGEARLAGLVLRAGPARSALKVLGGSARLEDVVLQGGAAGAFVDEGTLTGAQVELAGGYGLLARRGDVALDGGSARGTSAGVAAVATRLALSRFAIVGPAQEAGLSVAGGTATLSAVTIRAPGPAGIAASAGAEVDGTDVLVDGPTEEGGFLGDCVQAQKASVSLRASVLQRCGGAAVEVSGGSLRLIGVDAIGGAAGCVILVNGATADLEGNLCVGRGPALVVGSGARARLRMNRWRSDPAAWVDCAAGARIEVGPGERIPQPCASR